MPEVVYYVRAYATNINGTVYGNEIKFTTIANPLPKFITLSTTLPNSITQTSAISGGNITDDGGSPITDYIIKCCACSC
jgi:hypothetical protein